jgi:hypothetical protein
MWGAFMSKYLDEAIRRVKAARPASGFQPKTPEEWARLLAAFEHLAYAAYRDHGMSHLEAKRLSRLTHGGVVGRIFLETAFEGAEHE